jgi:hypothetical protein
MANLSVVTSNVKSIISKGLLYIILVFALIVSFFLPLIIDGQNKDIYELKIDYTLIQSGSTEDNYIEKTKTFTHIYENENGFNDFITRHIAPYQDTSKYFFYSYDVYKIQNKITFQERVSQWIYWLVIGLTVLINVTVAVVTFLAKKRQTMASGDFVSTVNEFGQTKKLIKPKQHLLPAYIKKQIKQKIIADRREIIESALLDYDKYLSGYYKTKEVKLSLETRQIKAIKLADKVKVEPLRALDVLQVTNSKPSRALVVITNDGQVIFKHGVSTAVSKTIFALLSLSLISVAIALTGWVSAIVTAFGVFMTYISSILKAEDYVLRDLRNSVIHKTDFLISFDNEVKLEAKDEIKEDIKIYEGDKNE